MLLGLMVIVAVMAGWFFYRRRHGWAVLSLVCLLVIQGGLVLDASHHYGTTLRATTTAVKILPVGSIRGNHVLLTKAIKEGKTTYTAYASRRANGKTSVILDKHKRVQVTFTDKTAQRLTTNRRYHYTSNWQKWLFSGVTNEGQLQRQTVSYRLTPSWHALSKTAIKRVEKQLATPKMKRQAKAAVAKARQQQPDTTKKVQSQLQQQALHDFVGRVMDQAAK